MLIEHLLEKTNNKTYNLHLGKKYKKTKVKMSNKPANIKTLDTLIKTLKDTGEITGHGVHRIKQPLPSEVTGRDETGWVVAWLSRADEWRLAYKRFGDNTIEVKIGKPKDIGYSH